MNRRIMNLCQSKEDMQMKTKIKRISLNLSSENAKKFTNLIDQCFEATNNHDSFQKTVDIVFNAVIIAGINVILKQVFKDCKETLPEENGSQTIQ